MKNKFLNVMCCAACLLLQAGCEESFDMDFPDYVSGGIAFEGSVTSEHPPYFFHLTRPAAMAEEDNVFEGIDDATVVVTDLTEGIRDTLQLVEPYMDYGGMFYNYYDYFKQEHTRYNANGMFEPSGKGMYVTTKIYGIEGHSYQLDIYYEGKHCQSDVQRMEPALIFTDIKLKKFDLGEKGKSWAPCISFINPRGVDNYYLFKPYYGSYTYFSFKMPENLLDTGQNWGYSILSDEYLEENVVDFLIDDGENALSYPTGWDYPKTDSVFVWAQTISKSCYDVLGQLIEQFRTDGGAYTPVPTTVRGNISGGVYGYFSVCAVSEIGIATGEPL